MKTLSFRITVPTAFPFLTRYLTLCPSGDKAADEATKQAASYYMERTLQEHDCLDYEPSLVAAAAVYLAVKNRAMGHPRPDEAVALLRSYTTYSLPTLRSVAKLISKKVSEEPVTASRRQLIAVKKKFAGDKYGNVSEIYDHPVLEDGPEDDEESASS
ncbi:hypothetical protein TeGR_g13754 [Tetraparma gracilis]|uniref:Cyclin C-terminal domain-containing protein n=1 Tax=Tetraparma gracilis TaxID=2962635 RepID=A0ABQ6M497_9STRA|nr:hypothetical protein TeGR_g13754 [Tetraparma gracilis]